MRVSFAALYVTLLCNLALTSSLSQVALTQYHVAPWTIQDTFYDGEHTLVKLDKPERSKRAYTGGISDVGLTGNYLLVIAEVTIGNQTFKVQVDTGSTLLAVDESGCIGCGGAPDPELVASTSTALMCSSSSCTYSVCFENTDYCGFDVIYGSGESITGVLATNNITLGGFTATNVLFGGIGNSTFDFESPYADGIMGLAYNNTDLTCRPNCVTPLFDDLVKQNGIPNIFALYLDYEYGGTLTLGGIDSSLYTGDIAYTPITQANFYNVELLELQMGGHTISSGSKFGQTIVDSGTTELILPSSVARALYNYAIAEYPSSKSIIENLFEGYCYTDDSIISYLPTLQFLFNGATVDVPAKNYILPVANGTYTIYCLGLAEESSGTILGDVFLRGLYTVFDRENNRIGFASVNATGTTTTTTVTTTTITTTTMTSGISSTTTASALFLIFCSLLLLDV